MTKHDAMEAVCEGSVTLYKAAFFGDVADVWENMMNAYIAEEWGLVTYYAEEAAKAAGEGEPA